MIHRENTTVQVWKSKLRVYIHFRRPHILRPGILQQRVKIILHTFIYALNHQNCHDHNPYCQNDGSNGRTNHEFLQEAKIFFHYLFFKQLPKTKKRSLILAWIVFMRALLSPISLIIILLLCDQRRLSHNICVTKNQVHFLLILKTICRSPCFLMYNSSVCFSLPG